MRLLVTNDDGINAPGLWALVKALRDLGEVIVVAPDREQSGVGASFSLHNPVRVRRLRRRGVRAYAVEGTPGDAVVLGLGYIAKDEAIDMVVAGINQGSNTGNDVFLSGTVGAALHGHFRGIPSMAVSMPLRKRLRYGTAAQVARTLIPLIAGNGAFKGLLLNVTVPNLGPEAIKGVEITRLRANLSTFEVKPGNDGRRDYSWIALSRPKRRRAQIQEGTDVWALRNKRVSITPLQTDLTAYSAAEGLTGLRGALAMALGPVGVTEFPAS